MAKGKHRHAGLKPHNLSTREIVDRIQRNGITLADMTANFDKGYAAGKKDSEDWAWDCILGSMAIALNREFGFGAQRISKVITSAANVMIEFTSNAEMYESIVRDIGIDIPRAKKLMRDGEI